jgi:catechol 2,3-dioxygenase-like lactoylglutathione lyase family enzyme
MTVDIKRTGHTAITVDDVKLAADFYCEHFGFEIGIIAEDWGIIRKNGDDIAFIKKGAGSHPPHFGLRVGSHDEVDDAYDQLKEKVKILKERKMHRDKSYSFYFEDPDRNIVELIFDPNNP